MSTFVEVLMFLSVMMRYCIYVYIYIYIYIYIDMQYNIICVYLLAQLICNFTIIFFRCCSTTFTNILLNFSSAISSGRQMLVGRTWIVVTLFFVNSTLDKRITASFTTRCNHHSWNSMERGWLWKALWRSWSVSLTQLSLAIFKYNL